VIKLRATWNIPGDGAAHEADAAYFATHLPHVRELHGVVRHGVLRFLKDARGCHPAWWRGEELWFENIPALEQAAASAAWSACVEDRFTQLVSGLRLHLFQIDEEFVPADAPPPSLDGTAIALCGIWQVPSHLTPDQVDPVYLDVHVPGVRRLPRLRRHTVMRGLGWPAGQWPWAYRSAEIRFAAMEDFTATFGSPAYEGIRSDGFTASICGPDVDIYVIEEEWTP
jgi:hypothetical protein